MIVVDTSFVLAYMNRADTHHRRASDWLDVIDDDLVTTPLILAEVDHMLDARGGPQAADSFRADLSAGAYLVEWWAGAVATAVEVAGQYRDLRLGLADASLVGLAAHVHTVDIATFDHKHFRAVRPIRGGPAFRLLPEDA